MARGRSREAVVVGLGLIGVGVAWTLANLGRIDLLATLRTYWPLLLIVWGGIELTASLTRPRRPR
jgi:hypothetical protein